MTQPTAITSLAPSGASPFRRLFARRLAALGRGTLEFEEGGERLRFGAPAPDGLTARLVVHSPRFYRRVVLGGTLGAAESYIDGDFGAPDLTALVRLVLQNQALLDGIESGAGRLAGLGARLLSSLRPNTRTGSRRNIAHHYDLGNDFFERMLDATLSYSSGIFPDAEASLEAASQNKLELLCKKLELAPGDRLLEIGTGWGGLALHAAAHHGAHVTTTTISEQQLALARERVSAAGLDDRIQLLGKDYRDLEGSFDKLVSVEMIEAIGPEQYPTFFRKCAELLEPGGRLVLQSITIAEHVYARHVKEIDFIKRYIFPGSSIPSVSALAANAGLAGLTLRSADDFGGHYARTLRAWRDNVERERAFIVERYGERFFRMWCFYLAYCEAGFSEGYLGLLQAVFEKPKWRQP